MTIVECPVCDAPASYDEEAAVLDCALCAVRLELADETPRIALAAAA